MKKYVEKGRCTIFADRRKDTISVHVNFKIENPILAERPERERRRNICLRPDS